MLILLRHGRTEANRAGLLQGRVDNALDSHGERQAQDAAAHLEATVKGGIHRVVASPLLRAQQTAAAVAERAGLRVDTEERFLEINYGDWEEKPLSQVSPEVWKQWRSDLDFRPPGGETLNELGARVRSAVKELAEEAAATNVVVVSHVSPMKAMLAWALDVSDETSWHMHVAQASICRIEFRSGRPVLASMNEHIVV